MAPSPTGFLHVGNVRTALFNWLFARHEGGEFLLRIENTDTGREVAEAAEQIQSSLRWLGIEWDGEVTFQLDRLERCQAEANRLVDEGAAYVDDGALRFRMPDDGVTAWDDLVLGPIEVQNETIEDLVILRSDGRPTYNFASPVEDWLDGITHVIRGRDHVPNTPKQIQILTALGAEPPRYGHVPFVNGTDGAGLSKRHGSVTTDEFRAQGYLPEALVNYLALLGWSYDDKTTIMSRDELVERFSLERVSKSPAVFDYEKLTWMNGVYLRALPEQEYGDALARLAPRPGLRLGRGARSPSGAARPGEDRAALGVPRLRGLPLRRRWNPTRHSSTAAGSCSQRRPPPWRPWSHSLSRGSRPRYAVWPTSVA